MRRGLGRGRTLIAVGAVVGIVAMPLPWLTVGGIILSAQTANGFEGSGVIMFLACVAMLALIVLPYTTKTRQAAIDRPLSYVVLVVAGVGGLGVQLIELLGTEGAQLGPTDAPGPWLAVTGMALATWGMLELVAERLREA